MQTNTKTIDITLTISTQPEGMTSEFEVLYWSLTEYRQQMVKLIAKNAGLGEGGADVTQHYQHQEQIADELLRSLNLSVLDTLQGR